MLAGVGVGIGLPVMRVAWGGEAAGPRAVRLVGGDGTPVGGAWQHWADASRVPTVAARVTVRLTGCPALPRAAGCVITDRPTVVYLRTDVRHPRAVMLHELGHVYDLMVLANDDRGVFRRIMRRPRALWWSGKVPLAEWFAEAYSWCARHARIVSVARYAIYGYNTTPAQHRATCSLIRRAERDRKPPAAAPAPPIVTRDPAPNAAPPTARAVVPGDPAHDPGSVPDDTVSTHAEDTSPWPVGAQPAGPAATPSATPQEAPTAIPEPGEVPTTTPEAPPTTSPDPGGVPTSTPVAPHHEP